MLEIPFSILCAVLAGWDGDGPGQQHRPAGQGAGIDEVRAGLPLQDQRQHPQKSELHVADGDHAPKPEEDADDSASV